MLICCNLPCHVQLFHRGPKNTDVFSESYTWPTSEDLPEHIREGQQKIKDLLLQVGYWVSVLV